ncbi:MAG: hypothetical protein ACOYCD_00475 [Kiritimatiellia bacterium]
MHKKHKIFRLLTPAALTGICRSDGSSDTLIREFIRVSGCSPIHVRIADSAACVRGESSSDTLAPWRFNPVRVHPWFLWFSTLYLVSRF